MNPVKQWFTDMWSRVLVVGAAVIAILAWVISMKNSKNADLQSQVDESTTQKKADVTEAQIKEDMVDDSLKQSQINQQQQALKDLEAKRKEIPAAQANLTPEQVTNYWKNN